MKPRPYQHWTRPVGLLVKEADEQFSTAFHGWLSPAQRLAVEDFGSVEDFTLDVDAFDTAYGFIAQGHASVDRGTCADMHLSQGMWFVQPGPCVIKFSADHLSAFVAIRHDFKALAACGGPVESMGRLSYIDGCSDTLLAAPAKLGDPCLNLLHFPGNINQTQHTHPSARLGIVLAGNGECIAWPNGADAPPEVTPLRKGIIFSIPTGCLHCFRTPTGGFMDVIAYHPDSDWGPTDEEHPMVNRTHVDGKKIDNTTAQHKARELARG